MPFTNCCNQHDYCYSDCKTPSEEKRKQRKALADGAKGQLKEFCSKCKKVKIFIHSNFARGFSGWFREGDRKAKYEYDCQCKRMVKKEGSRIYDKLLGVK